MSSSPLICSVLCILPLRRPQALPPLRRRPARDTARHQVQHQPPERCNTTQSSRGKRAEAERLKTPGPNTRSSNWMGWNGRTLSQASVFQLFLQRRLSLFEVLVKNSWTVVCRLHYNEGFSKFWVMLQPIIYDYWHIGFDQPKHHHAFCRVLLRRLFKRQRCLAFLRSNWIRWMSPGSACPSVCRFIRRDLGSRSSSPPPPRGSALLARSPLP